MAPSSGSLGIVPAAAAAIRGFVSACSLRISRSYCACVSCPSASCRDSTSSRSAMGPPRWGELTRERSETQGNARKLLKRLGGVLENFQYSATTADLCYYCASDLAAVWRNEPSLTRFPSLFE